MPAHWLTIHACYPQDFGTYYNLKDLTVAEVIDLMKADPNIELAKIAAADGEEMWLNKGFILLDHVGISFSIDERRTMIKKECKAVYLHDGNYRLIQFQ